MTDNVTVEEMYNEVLEKFRKWFEQSKSNFTYKHPLLEEDKSLIRIASEVVAERISAELEIYRRTLAEESSKTPMKDLLIRTGKILLINDIQKILKSKYLGVSEKDDKNAGLLPAVSSGNVTEKRDNNRGNPNLKTLPSENTAEKIEQLIMKEINACFRSAIVDPRNQSDMLLNHALYHRIDSLGLFYSKFSNIPFMEVFRGFGIDYDHLQKLNPEELIYINKKIKKNGTV